MAVLSLKNVRTSVGLHNGVQDGKEGNPFFFT